MIDINLTKTLQGPDGKMMLAVEAHINQGDLVVIYGPSGAGKTSILRMLAGLLQPESGKIAVNNVCWFDSEKNIHLKPQQRKVGFVWQDYALFPNMTVKENLQYALPRSQPAHILTELIDIIELNRLQDRMPQSLSGGQQQRVALARALVRSPEVLLLDEPLSALDEGMRVKMQDFLLKVHHQYGLTTILVTHDMAEIFKLAKKIFLLHNGKIFKQGAPHEVFTHQDISGKYRITGTVLKIDANDVVYVVSVLIGSQIIKVIATAEERKGLKTGDKVLIISKAFNPIIMKINN
ncbi:ATP-binding cassette domain-containing protein [Fulvivirgaceae bacterium BMA12]|uniref:ATP-binding cassette domain-containing protein n=1 Tax=Agaribacillus aureus TaxID=3051825 RepID=A0ABT8LA96_9BACT|nr:ATP-binding cassette domain-containing protein [Fulvivirgaceae bacterium BMA12]